MKLTVQATILCAAVVLSVVPSVAQTPLILEPKTERREGPPLWTSVEVVADGETIIDQDFVDRAHLHRYIQWQQREMGISSAVESTGEKPSITIIPSIPSSECKITRSSMCDERPGSNSNLTDLATYSLSIVRGTIRTVDPGFAYSEPASLLGIEVLETIQGSTPASPFYIAYPVARFQIGPYHFCSINKGFEPQPGDQILLFDYWGSIDRDDVLYHPRFEQMFFQSQKGTLYLPPRLRGTPGLENIRTLDDVVGRLRSEMSRQSRGSVR